MEAPVRVSLDPFPDLWVLVRGIVVDDGMDGLAGRQRGINGAEEANVFLMAMLLHAAAEDFSAQHIESGKQCRCTMALVVMRHRAAAALFQGQARLRAVMRLDLAVLINGQHHGMGRRINPAD